MQGIDTAAPTVRPTLSRRMRRGASFGTCTGRGHAWVSSVCAILLHQSYALLSIARWCLISPSSSPSPPTLSPLARIPVPNSLPIAGNKTIALDSRGDERATPAGAGSLGSGAPATTAAATASGGAAEDATADDGASSGCRTYVPARIRRLAALPLDQALLSADSEGMSQHGSSGAPTAINFEPSAALAAKYQEAKDRKARGEGVVRFVPNPQEGWGPKARAHGNTNAANAATTVGDAGADAGGARQAGGKKQQRGGNLNPKASSSSGASSTLTWEPGQRSSAASTAAESTAAPPSQAAAHVAESNGGAYDKNGDDGTDDGHGDSSSGSDSKRSRLE